MSKDEKTVFVGMSGGVDSSVTAALLKERGFDVHGVFIKVWEPTDEITGKPLYPGVCTWREDRRDAMRVAAQLNIPFHTLDLEKEYKQEIVDYMVEEYRKGRVPNPDVMCNKYIKFGSFLDWALEQVADYVATGHYARLSREDTRYATQNTNIQLLKGKDRGKDQSYFLWTLTQKELAYTLFPIGEFDKSQVRKLAEEYDLATAEKKDSQGLCFIGDIEMREFLSDFIKPEKGDVLNEKGETIGEHDGAFFFTIGQRHGFTITNKETQTKPHYVVKKDMNTNTITVSSQSPSETGQIEVELTDTNWICGEPLEGEEMGGKIRYRQEDQACIYKEGKLIFRKKQTVSPGQSVVLYNGDTCLGGGIVS